MAQNRNRLLYKIECRQQQQQQQHLDPEAGQPNSQLASKAIELFYSQRIEELDFQRAEKGLPIDFVKLFRQHTHYKRLGISLSPLDLLYMEDYSSKWSEQYVSPTLALSELFRHQDSCTQSDAHLTSKFEEEQRVEGGFRLDAVIPTAKPPPKDNSNKQTSYGSLLIESNQNKKPGKGGGKKRDTESSATKLPCTCCICKDSRPEKEEHERQQKHEPDQGKAIASSNWLPVHSSYTKSHCPSNCKQCDTRGTHTQHQESEDEIQSYALRRTSMVINLPNKVAEQSVTLHDVRPRPRPRPHRRPRPRPGEEVKTLLSPRQFRCRPKQSMSTSCVTSCRMQITPTTSQSVTSTNSEAPAGSTDTLNDIWFDPDACKIGRSSESRLHQWPIDLQHVGWEGTAQLDAAGKRAALVRCEKYAALHRKLSHNQRAQGIVSRLQQLRRYQEKSDRHYHRSLLASDAFKKRHQVTRQRQPLGCQLHECPMRTPGCSRVSSEMLLAHFLAVHLSEPRLAPTEVGNSDQLLIKFKPKVFSISRNVCLSMIVYAREGDTQPSMCNMGLATEYAQHAGHFPLFVLACRTRLTGEQRRQEPRKQPVLTASCLSGEEIGENVLALWMVGLEMPQPLHVHMAVFNYRLDIIRSAIVPVRGLRKCHNSERFLTKSKNYMRLNGHDLHLLTENYREPIYLELTLRDYTLLDPPGTK